jgi:hypothetical protein
MLGFKFIEITIQKIRLTVKDHPLPEPSPCGGEGRGEEEVDI